jgi:hypothetical protein
MESSMGKLPEKPGSWIGRAIASETSGGIARFLLGVLVVAYAVEFVWERIL